MEGQTEEGWQGHLCGAAEGPRRRQELDLDVDEEDQVTIIDLE